ncbi:MAG: MFS transporter [Paracoccus sp. (in: a-proteobacteria)]|uniref:MFS transporter n=1 Tax=Paracoccus sp. TaxID=267 RepID=UPI0030030A14
MSLPPSKALARIEPALTRGRASLVGRHAVAQLMLWSGLYYLFPALTGRILAETGWSASILTASYTAGFLLWAFSSPLVGRTIDIGHGIVAMRCGALVGASLLVAMSQAQTLAVFAPLMVLLGASMAATLYDPCFAILLRRFGASAASPVATVTLVAGLATLLTFPMVGWLLQVTDWRAVMLAAAALVLAAAVLIPSEGAARPADRSRHDMPRGRASPTVLLIGLSFATLMFSHAALLFILPLHLRKLPETADFALILPALLGPAQIFGRLVCAPLIRLFDPVLLARSVFGVMLLPPLALLVVPYQATTILPILLLQGAGYGMHTILRPVLTRNHVPPFRLGRDLGLIAMIGLVMMALGPAAGGVVWQGAGFQVLAWLLLAMNLVGVLLLFPLPRRAER